MQILMLDRRLVQKPSVSLRLNARLQQSLRLLQLSGSELTALVREAVNENPLLEYEAMPDYAWKAAGRGGPAEKDPDDRLSNYADRNDTLEGVLIRQLGLIRLRPEVRKTAEFLAGCVDDNGFLTISSEEAARWLQVSPSIVAEALEALQSLEPAGVGARSLSECLQLQIRRRESPLPWAEEVVRDHLEDLAKGKFGQIAKALGADESDVRKVYSYLRELNPRPGSAVAGGANLYVIPDAYVVHTPEGYAVRINDEVVPRLTVNRAYTRRIARADHPETYRYLQEHLQAARAFVRGLEQRKATLAKVAQAIIDRQHRFLERGVSGMVPLTMKELSDMLGVHESTVSRAVQGKSIRTPHGTFELKFFFSAGLAGRDGEPDSSAGIKARIREWIQGEDKRRPLSDQQLCGLLAAGNIEISRRTVAKYREELNIPPSSLRKRRG